MRKVRMSARPLYHLGYRSSEYATGSTQATTPFWQDFCLFSVPSVIAFADRREILRFCYRTLMNIGQATDLERMPRPGTNVDPFHSTARILLGSVHYITTGMSKCVTG